MLDRGGAQRSHEAVYLAELRQAADRAGIGDRVRFLGQRTDVPDLLAAADVFCQPNTGPEPFGIAFVEALYAGLPVVTRRWRGAGDRGRYLRRAYAAWRRCRASGRLAAPHHGPGRTDAA